MTEISKMDRKEGMGEWKGGYGRENAYVQNTLNEIFKELIKIVGCLFCFVYFV